MPRVGEVGERKEGPSGHPLRMVRVKTAPHLGTPFSPYPVAEGPKRQGVRAVAVGAGCAETCPGLWSRALERVGI